MPSDQGLVLMVSQKRGDVTNDVEIQDERPLVAVHEVNRLGPPNLEHPEVNEIIADGVLRVINPAHGGASLGAPGSGAYR